MAVGGFYTGFVVFISAADREERNQDRRLSFLGQSYKHKYPQTNTENKEAQNAALCGTESPVRALSARAGKLLNTTLALPL